MRRHERTAFEPAIVAAMDKPPARIARVVSLLIVAFVAATAVWLSVSRIDVVVTATGEVVPAGRVKRVQSAADGVIRDIRVRDGQRVARGDVLLTLDKTESLAERARLMAARSRRQLIAQRLRAELGEAATLGNGVDAPAAMLDTERRRLDANRLAHEARIKELTSHVQRAQARLRTAERRADQAMLNVAQQRQRVDDRTMQAERGLVPREEAIDAEYRLAELESEEAVAREQVLEARSELAAARDAVGTEASTRRSGLLAALAEAGDALDEIGQRLVALDEQLERQIVRAPVGGIVQELTVNTIGGVVARAEPLMVIVPDGSDLELSVRIRDKDIGFVNTNQPARVKIDAFEFTRYGTIPGTLGWVGGDAVADDNLGPVYPARVSLTTDTLPNTVDGRRAVVSGGMRASVDIVVGERRLLDYFLAPLLRYRDESLRER